MYFIRNGNKVFKFFNEHEEDGEFMVYDEIEPTTKYVLCAVFTTRKDAETLLKDLRTVSISDTLLWQVSSHLDYIEE